MKMAYRLNQQVLKTRGQLKYRAFGSDLSLP